MAERTAAEVLAMLQDELAKQEAARQLFESDREPRPTGQTVKGIPEVEENLLKAIASPFVPIERDVIREPQSTFETVDRLVPGAMDGEALRQEEVRTSYTPGVYGDARLASPPIVDAISSGLRFGDELLFGTPEQKEAARTTLREGIAGLPGLPQEMVQSMMRGAESVERGGVVTRDAEGNITRPDDFFAGALGLGAGMGIGTKLSAAGAKGPVLGIFGGEKGELSGEQAKETVEMLEEQGLSPEDVWNAQAGANTKKAYRSSLDNKVRFEIPMDNVNFKSIVREVEDPDVEMGKLIAAGPDGDLQRLQAMQSLRIRKINDKDYVTVPGFFEFNEKELNKYGFSKYDHKREFAQFPMMQLEELIDAPQLFEEYPQLRRVRIKPTPPLSFFVKGAYDPDTKIIFLDSVPNTPKGRKEMMSTLIHEIQHAVQDIEGLYGGANTGMFEPFGFGDRKKKNRDLIQEQEELLEEKLKVFGFESQGQELNKRTFLNLLRRDGRPRGGKVPTDQQFSRTLAEIDDKDFRQVKRRMLAFLKSRAEEENIRADTGVDVREESRRKLNQLIKDRQEDMRSHNKRMGREIYTKEEIKNVDAEYRSQAFRYRGSDEDLIRLNNDLKEIAEKSNDPALRNMNVENITERFSKSFDEVVPALRPLIKEDKQIDEIERQASQMYQGNPGEVEARHAQLRFEGVKKSGGYYEDGEMKLEDRDISAEELRRIFPEETQKKVLPKEGLVFSVSEGRKTAELPSERLAMSQRTPRELEKLLLDKRLSLIKSLNEDSFGTTPAEVARNRKRVDREIRDLERRILELRQDPSYAGGGAVQKFANGGMVNNMRKPVLSRGLSGLLSSYTSGPLARISVPRETPQNMFRGGAPGMRDVGLRGPQRTPEIDQSAITAALANVPPSPPAQTNVAIQSPAERLAASTVPTRTAVTPVAQALTGARPTDFLGYETTEGAAEMGATAPGQTPFEPGMLITDPTGPTAEEIAAQQAAEEAAAQAAAEEAARIEAERLAAEEAAQIAAAQEAQRIEQERLAAEQLAAQQAAAEQAAAQQAAAEQLAAEQLAAEQLAAQEAAEAAEAARQQELLAQQEAQRIAQEQFDAQVAAEQAAAQQTAAEVLAQEQAAAQAAQTQTQDARVESASDKIDAANQKQVVADVANQNLSQATNQGADSATIETLTLDATLKQQDADAAALEAELAVAPDPTPIYEAPTQGELLQAAADADTGPLFTTPTDLGTVVPRSTFGLVPQTTGIMSFLGQPNFDVSDAITDYTSGYPSSQDMQFRRTFYPFQQVTDEEAQNQYMAEIFKPVADMSQFRPALTFGEKQQTREKGSFVDAGPFGEQYKNYIPENTNTGAAASAPGQYGLDSNQMYQCPEGYNLAFVNGRATCKSIKPRGGPGRRKDVDPEIVELGGRG